MQPVHGTPSLLPLSFLWSVPLALPLAVIVSGGFNARKFFGKAILNGYILVLAHFWLYVPLCEAFDKKVDYRVSQFI
jgi:hypothetical protein